MQVANDYVIAHYKRSVLSQLGGELLIHAMRTFDTSENKMKYLFFVIISVFLYFTLGNVYSAQPLPEGFVYVKDIIPSIQLETRYYTTDNFVGQRIDGYESSGSILTSKAATALKGVQEELRAFELGLKIYDAYRPQRAVNHFVRWAKNISDTKMKSKYYPDVDKSNLFKDGYIAEKSSHSRGSAVDLTIISTDSGKEQELDMGTGWDFFSPQSWPGNTSASQAQRAHRMLLQTIMTKHGFQPLKEEWWHFSLRDEPFPDTYFDFPIN